MLVLGCLFMASFSSSAAFVRSMTGGCCWYESAVMATLSRVSMRSEKRSLFCESEVHLSSWVARKFGVVAWAFAALVSSLKACNSRIRRLISSFSLESSPVSIAFLLLPPFPVGTGVRGVTLPFGVVAPFPFWVLGELRGVVWLLLVANIVRERLP